MYKVDELAYAVRKGRRGRMRASTCFRYVP